MAVRFGTSCCFNLVSHSQRSVVAVSCSRQQSCCVENKRRSWRIKASSSSSSSSRDIHAELDEESKFVPLNVDDPIYGPPAFLLVGFEVYEREKIQSFLKELDGDFLKIIYCTDDMLNQTVWDAMHTEQSSLEGIKIAESLPRVCILSGLSGEEMIMFIDAFPESGLKPAVFAALVPNSADKFLRDVIEEIMGDHEMMTAKQ